MRSPNGQRISKACEFCGKVVDLHPYRAEKFRYCSNSCTKKAKPKERHGKMLDCKRCGKEFYVPQSRVGKSTFCSRSCASAANLENGKAPWWKGGDITFCCIVCGKEVTRERGNTGGTYEFCSTQCHDVHRKKRVIIICVACGKEFEQRLSKSDHKFCSWTCYISYAVRENSHKWKGGERGRKFYPKEWNKTFKKKIRERDNYTCAICKEYGDNVHHINYVKNDTVPENCITLCRSCHAKTNSNREYWINYFASTPL